MPRQGLTTEDVVAAAADAADEVGYANLTLALLAQRLGVRPPSLYKHVDGLADLQHRIATLAITELGEAVRDAAAGVAGRDALAALAVAFRHYGTTHPGRYAATVGAEFHGSDDPLMTASRRVVDLTYAILRGYGIDGPEADHAARAVRSALHGFTALEAADGFKWVGNPDESFTRLIDILDLGLRGSAGEHSR
jgi:AcrR family transcriptional regulator